MDLLNQTKKICQNNGIIPARSRGQNFLISESVYDEIIEAADLKTSDMVIEVGPGLGFLTRRLAHKAKQVWAVELDGKLARLLEKDLKKEKIKNVKIINQNILDIKIGDLMTGDDYKIVANLPYNITAIFLRRILSGVKKPKSLILMLQKEVAERISARPPKMSLLSNAVQFYAQAEIMSYVDKKHFWPQPEVDSAIIQLQVKNRGLKVEEKKFFQLLKFGFSQKRKKLKNNLSAGYQMSQEKIINSIKLANINQDARAQELSLDDWLRLFKFFC